MFNRHLCNVEKGVKFQNKILNNTELKQAHYKLDFIFYTHDS